MYKRQDLAGDRIAAPRRQIGQRMAKARRRRAGREQDSGQLFHRARPGRFQIDAVAGDASRRPADQHDIRVVVAACHRGVEPRRFKRPRQRRGEVAARLSEGKPDTPPRMCAGFGHLLSPQGGYRRGIGGERRLAGDPVTTSAGQCGAGRFPQSGRSEPAAA